MNVVNDLRNAVLVDILDYNGSAGQYPVYMFTDLPLGLEFTDFLEARWEWVGFDSTRTSGRGSWILDGDVEPEPVGLLPEEKIKPHIKRMHEIMQSAGVANLDLFGLLKNPVTEKHAETVDAWWNHLNVWERRRCLLYIDEVPSLKYCKFSELPKHIKNELDKLMRTSQREGCAMTSGELIVSAPPHQIMEIHKNEHMHLCYPDIFKVCNQVMTPDGEGTIVAMSLKYADVQINNKIIKYDLLDCIKLDDALEADNGMLTSWDRLSKHDRTRIAGKLGIPIPDINVMWSEMPQNHRNLIKTYTIETNCSTHK